MEDHRIVIDGRPVLVQERKRPIPDRLDLLLEGGRDGSGRLWSALRVWSRVPVSLGGPAASCAVDDHRLVDWLRGFHLGSDSIARDLRLLLCADCGAVCVRDVSIDQLPGLARPGRLAPRRRDKVIGWYSGARPRQRVYS